MGPPSHRRAPSPNPTSPATARWIVVVLLLLLAVAALIFDLLYV